MEKTRNKNNEEEGQRTKEGRKLKDNERGLLHRKSMRKWKKNNKKKEG
jgi:hypothetical protein